MPKNGIYGSNAYCLYDRQLQARGCRDAHRRQGRWIVAVNLA